MFESMNISTVKITPMLASPAVLDKIAYPVYTSPKLDGIRCLVDFGMNALSRTSKLIPNRYVREMLRDISAIGFDGELITYSESGQMDRFEDVSSKIMSAAGQPNFRFHVFDTFHDPQEPYEHRLDRIRNNMRFSDFAGYLEIVEANIAHDLDELFQHHARYTAAGYEGTMIRSPGGPYKFGRSTVREGYLLKLKDFQDAEATIVGYTERLNHDPSLGAFVMQWGEVEFSLGTGFTEEQRVEFWQRRDEMVGKLVTFTYQGIGTGGRPRFPSFKGFRRDIEVR